MTQEGTLGIEMREIRIRLYGIIALALLCAAPRAIASDLKLYYLHDATAQLSLEQVRTQFDNSTPKRLWRPGIDGDGGHHWFFLTIPKADNKADEQLLQIHFANIDNVTAWVDYDDRAIEVYQLGDEVAFERWPINYRKPSVPLTAINTAAATVYLRVISDTPVVLPVTVQDYKEVFEEQLFEHLFFGAFFGAILMLAMYNLGLYFSLRDKSYLFYVIYVLAFALVQLTTTGIGQQYLWPGANNLTTKIAYCAIAMTNFSIVHFALHFINVGKHRPRLYQLMRIGAYLALTPLLLMFFTDYSPVQVSLDLFSFLNITLIVIAAGSILQKEMRPAVYLLISYSVLFSAIVLAILRNVGVLGAEFVTDYLMSIAIIIEAVILSVGLSERIAVLRIEKELSEREKRKTQQTFCRQLMETREREKATMSKLLHDSVNHDLLVLRNRMLRSIDGNGGMNTIHHDIGSAAKELNAIIDTIRDISHSNYPPLLKHLGLEQSLQVLLENAFDGNIDWRVKVEPNHLSFEGQLFVYRAVQECVSNVIKHAAASECVVVIAKHVRKGQEWVSLTIKDDGNGMRTINSGLGFGLATLRDGCEALGGEFYIESQPNFGTQLTIKLPSRCSDYENAWKNTIAG